MKKLSCVFLGAALLAAACFGRPGICRADDLHWRSKKVVAKQCNDRCEKSNFANEVLTDSCKTQCGAAVKVYKKWRAGPCNGPNRAGCFGEVMSKSIGMLPAEHQAWVTVADFGCKNK